MTGMTGDDIYRNFYHAEGPERLISGAAIVDEISGSYRIRAHQIRRLMARMESAWQGDAAGAAQRGAGPLAVEHEVSSAALDTAQDLTNRQAGSFGEAKGRVMPVPPKPEMQNPTVVFSDPTAFDDYERQIDERTTAARNNVDVMNGYSGASEYNTTNLPTSYGRLSDDRSGIDIGLDGVGGAGGAVIDSAARADGNGNGADASTGSMGDGNHRPSGGSPADGLGRAALPETSDGSPGGGSSGGGTANTPLPGVTTPEKSVPDALVPPVGPPESGSGRGHGMSIGTPAPGVLPVTPGTGEFGRPAPRDRFGGGSPGGPVGGGAGPRGNGMPGSPGTAAAEPPGTTARPGPVSGRGSVPVGGFPLGGAGRGRDGEDTEHQRPQWLEGGDPDELFDTDVLTAPPTIGAEDD